MSTLFKTVHGSRLYNLSTPDSDYDFFEVVTKSGKTTAHTKKRYAKQTIKDGIDSTVVDFGTFMVGCEKGVPQFLEAMFSNEVVGEDCITDLRRNYRCGTAVLDTYFRTIKSFALAEGYKSKRHALRLALNARDIGRYGRFNPSLSREDVLWISDMANKSHEDVLGLAFCTAW